MKFKILFILVSMAHLAIGQSISGKVLEKTPDGEQPLVGAIVKWLTPPQNPVSTDSTGAFSLNKSKGQHQLVLSYIGFKTDTMMAHGEGPFTFYLSTDSQSLGEVVVKSRGTSIDRIAPQQIQIITTKELAKAACCNLSESFETNASVSVSYSDAITGARQLQMMGLSGKYIQTNIENMPGVRGLTIPFGLNYVPGTWIQSIDIAKGVSSVVNGYESMAGAINVELQKPDNSERLYLNAYVNELGRSEVNLNMSKKLSDKLSVGLLSHGSLLKNSIDRNNDSFKDLPEYDQINLLNRWKYNSDRFSGQLGINYMQENREGGQMETVINTPRYVFSNQTKRLNLFSKTAVLFPEAPYRGLGLIMNGSFLKSQSVFGSNPYDGSENTFYSNLIYQDILGNTQHTYKAGLSFLADSYRENFANFNSPVELNRDELVPGAFFEYTYNKLDKSVLVLGMRLDQHNIFGTQFTPRMHFKQDVGNGSTVRLSAGKGFRVPNPLAENYGKLVSSRKVVFEEPIAPEISWNVGGSLTHEFGKNSFILDAYHSFFEQQQIMDMESAGLLRVYNSTGNSFATSVQAELSLVPSDRWELKAAYRWLNVKHFMRTPEGENVVRQRVFVPRDLVLLNGTYSLPYDKWKVDLTLQYKGKQRIPFETADRYADGFVTVNTQISRNFVNWEYYLGAENLTNFRQPNPIITPDNPFGDDFDAGQTWGPVVGRIIYAGARFKIR